MRTTSTTRTCASTSSGRTTARSPERPWRCPGAARPPPSRWRRHRTTSRRGCAASSPAGRAAPSHAPASASASASASGWRAEALRAEGRRRLAERVWFAASLIERRGWDAGWSELLTRAVRASAGRRAGREDTSTIAAALTARLAGADGSWLTTLRRQALDGRPGALIEALRGDAHAPLLGRARAAELGWNAALPLLMAAATVYDDPDLALRHSRARRRVAGAAALRPYGGTARAAPRGRIEPRRWRAGGTGPVARAGPVVLARWLRRLPALAPTFGSDMRHSRHG